MSDTSLPPTERATGAKPSLSRRRFLNLAGIGAGAVAAGGGSALAAPAAGTPDPNIVPVPDWTKTLGAPVNENPYGKPSVFEKDVVRREVTWLTASSQSSVSFTPLYALDSVITPNGLCFVRHHGGQAEIDPDKYRLMIHGLVDS